jgi:esterase
MEEYDEFATLAPRVGSGKPIVARLTFDVLGGQKVSAISWADQSPALVFIHGRGQNAHTWDTVATALGLPVLAVDLPGHGHSDWREDHDYGPWPNADALAPVLVSAAREARAVVGMSLGGSTSIRLAAKYPELVRRLVVVDTTPGTRTGRPPLTKEQVGALSLLEGPGVYASFDEMLQKTSEAIPGRPIESLRMGVRHNSRQLEDGRWIWRYDRDRPEGGGSSGTRDSWWADLEVIEAPILLVRAGRSGLVTDEDVEEFRRRQPTARIETITESGHSVQSDRPLELVSLIEDFIATT